MISTIDGYQNFINYDHYGITFKDKIVPIYIEVNDKNLLLRSIDRESNNCNPNYLQVCNRFLKDHEDFKTIPENFIRINNDGEWRNTIQKLYTIIYNNILEIEEEPENFRNLAVKGLYKYLYDFINSTTDHVKRNHEFYNFLRINADCNPYIEEIVSNGPYNDVDLLLREYRINGNLICNDDINPDRVSVFDVIFYKLNASDSLRYAIVMARNHTAHNLTLCLAYNGKSFSEFNIYYNRQFNCYMLQNYPDCIIEGFGTNRFSEDANYFMDDVSEDAVRKTAQNMLKKLHSIVIPY